MAKKSQNENLQGAKTAKKDEFYTQLADIEKEIRHYKQHFAGKTIYCNCDDPEWSNFFRLSELSQLLWSEVRRRSDTLRVKASVLANQACLSGRIGLPRLPSAN